MADYISKITLPNNETYNIRNDAVTQTGNSENKAYPILFKNSNNTTDETIGVKYSNNITDNVATSKPFTYNPNTGILSVPKIQISIKDDSFGFLPYANNWNSLGASNLYWYRVYATHQYGTYSHITNWDAGKNIGTAATSSAAATLGSVNFYNTCAAGGTQTKTLLTADNSANSNITITLPSSSGTLALDSKVDGLLAAANAMIFKGTLGTGGTITELPATHGAGDTYRVITAGTWAGKYCEVGTLIICIKDGTTATDADWTSVETNEDGAVIGPTSSTDGNFVLFSGTTGRIIKNSSYSPSSFAAASHGIHVPTLPTSSSTAYFLRGDNTWSNTISGGLFKITNNNNTVTIGSANTSWCHFENSANIPFYFNHQVVAVDGFKVYNTATQLYNNYLTFSQGGGWYMSDATWIRTYGSKSVYMNTGTFRNDGTTQLRTLQHVNGSIVVDGDWVTGANGTAPTATTTDGTTTYSGATIGTSILTLGNNKIGANSASGVKDNAKGYLRIYGASSGYGELTYNDSMFQSTKSIYFSTSANSGINNEIRGIMATNDYWRVAGGATASNSGYMEISTADDATEPIYVRQYTGVFATLKRTLTLLDGSGNTSIPGTLTVTGQITGNVTGALTGNADTATTATNLANAPSLTAGTTDTNAITVTAGGQTSDEFTVPYATYTKYIEGTDDAASPGGALLRSGAGRSDNASGNTWIFWDTLGGTTNYWGLMHDQANNKFITYGSKTVSSWIRLNTGDTYLLGKLGLGYNPETSGNTYKLYVNGTTYLGDNVTLANQKYISRAGNTVSWNSSNTGAMLRQTSVNNWAPMLAMKSHSGWWIMGHYESSGFYDHLIFGLLSDVDVSGVANAENHFDYKVRLLPTIYTSKSGTATDRAFVTAPWASSKAAVGSTKKPVYINDDGVATEISYTIEKSVPSNAVFTDHYTWGDITSKPTSIALTGAVTATATTLGDGAISITTTVNHGHGHISSTGQITQTHQIANGDRLIVTDSANATTADKNKLIATTITFDGSTTSKALTQKGTWETFNNYSHPTGDGNLHVPANGTGNNGKFLQATGTAGTYQWASVTKSTVGLDNVTNDKQLPIAGGTLTGAVNTANNTWNKIGDDIQLGDINEAGTLGIQGLNGSTAIRFTTYNQTTKTTGGKITWDGTKFIITSTTPISASISGNAATATSATSAASATNATNAINDEDGNSIKDTYTQRYIQTVDLTTDDTNTWYPVCIGIPRNGMHRISSINQLDGLGKPTWASHNSGYTAVVEMLVLSSGWGTTAAQSICLVNEVRWLAANEPSPIGYSQFSNSSYACFWCRGGAKYKLLTDFIGTWTVYRESTTVSSQTIAPKTSNPGINITRSTITANISHANAANLTTTKNAVSYYTDTAGTFGTKASANGALYATEANGALSWGTLPVAQGGTGQTSIANIQAGKDSDGNAINTTYLKKSGGQMTGPLTWKDSTALPESTSTSYMLALDAFASGGTTKWITTENVRTSISAVKKVTSTDNAIVRFDGTGGEVQDSTATINDNGTINIKGKLIVNPSYDTSSNSYNEGIRINQASNGWSEIVVGGSADSTGSTSADLWIVGRRGVAGSKVGAVGDFTIENNDSTGAGLTIHKSSGGATLYTNKANSTGCLNIKNVYATTASAFTWITNCLAPNMAAKSNAIMLIGQANSSKNQAYLGFHYEGSGSNSNYLTLGLYGVDHLLKIFPTGQVSITTNVTSSSTSTGSLVVAGGTGIAGTLYVGTGAYISGTSTTFATDIFNISNSSDVTWTPSGSFLAPNLTATHYNAIQIGKKNEDKNVGHLSFYYAGNKSTSNRFALGFYNVTDILVVRADRKVGINTTAPSHDLSINGDTSSKKFIVTDTATTPVDKVTLQWNATDQSLDFVFA